MEKQMSLGDDILINILTRLPLKSFARAKCVSTSWQSLVSHDYVRNKLPPIVSFIFHDHSNSARSNEQLACYISTSNIAASESADLSFFPQQPNSTLIDCCNGLLLFYSPTSATYHACNVMTRKHVVLPRPSRESLLSALAFDPRRSQRFEVINFTEWHDQGADMEVFDSRHGKWATHRVEWGIASSLLSVNMHYFDRVLYLLAHPNRAVAVDLDAMSCALIELPEATEKGSCCFGESGGRLHLSVSDGKQVRVWASTSKGEWMLKHCAGLNVSRCRIAALHHEGEVVYIVVNDEKLVCYNVCKKRAEGVWESGEEGKGFLVGVWVYPFTRHLENCLATERW